jgi:Lsr2
MIPAVWDDKVLAETGRKTPAEKTVTLGYQGQWYKLDLSLGNSGELQLLLGPWLKAGCKTSEASRPGHPVRHRGRRSGEYYRRLREWAAGEGIKIIQDVHGKYNYTPALKKQFDDYLAGTAAGEG